jgi:SNF2 family DNA or RNA helicase
MLFQDICETVLKRHGFRFARLDGSLNQPQREKVLQSFTQSSSKIEILLISLKAGGVGLNLTCANVCFFMDSWYAQITISKLQCKMQNYIVNFSNTNQFILLLHESFLRWNPAVEQQAIERLHRIVC